MPTTTAMSTKIRAADGKDTITAVGTMFKINSRCSRLIRTSRPASGEMIVQRVLLGEGIGVEDLVEALVAGIAGAGAVHAAGAEATGVVPVILEVAVASVVFVEAVASVVDEVKI